MQKFRKTLLVLVSSLILVFGMVGTSYAGVMMQGFYWDAPSNGECSVGEWYDYLAGEASYLAEKGFTAIWFPPPCKGMDGQNSMGYDLFDHYDLGNYNQNGTTETRFGSRQELENAITTFHNIDTDGDGYADMRMDVYADVVLNHINGGSIENNPNIEDWMVGDDEYPPTQEDSDGDGNHETWTNFDYPHDNFEKSYKHFHPNYTHGDLNDQYETTDFGYDNCYYNDYDYMGNKLKDWSGWLKNTVGFDGYRLDFVKGIYEGYLSGWKDTSPMSSSFTVGEYWNGDRTTLKNWVDDTGMHAFDFALFYTLQDMCNSDGSFNMSNLEDAGLVDVRPNKAVTFVENHDTDEHDPITQNKMMAYAYILTHEGYPCVFWKDYYVYGLKDDINNLVWIHENLAAGSTSNLYSDSSIYIAQRNGDPGLVVGLNDSDSWKSKWVQTKWSNTTLHDYTGSAGDVTTDGDGWVEISIPPKGYSAWAPEGY